MQNDNRTHGLWAASAPKAPETHPLDTSASADVVIVGGGYTGLSCALHLAEAGKSVVLLEGMDIGHGGAGRNVGLINAGLWLMPDDVAGVVGADLGERLIHMLGSGPSVVMSLIDRLGIDCELERNGTLHCAVGKNGFREISEREAQWRRRGAPVHLLSAEETASRLGSHAYVGSLLDERAGTLQPLAYARGLARAAMAAGARLFSGSEVLSAGHDGSRWNVSTRHGKVDADWLVVGTDAYGTGLYRGTQRAQVRLPYFNLATEPLDPDLLQTILPHKEGVWDTKQILSSFRLDRAGRLVFGSVGALRNTGTAIHTAWARRALAKIYPQLGSVGFEHAWYGQIGMTSDAVPRLHRLGPNSIGILGYNGRGISPGTVFGRAIAMHISDAVPLADIPLPVNDIADVPLRAGRELYYELGAQAAHMFSSRGM